MSGHRSGTSSGSGRSTAPWNSAEFRSRSRIGPPRHTPPRHTPSGRTPSGHRSSGRHLPPGPRRSAYTRPAGSSRSEFGRSGYQTDHRSGGSLGAVDWIATVIGETLWAVMGRFRGGDGDGPGNHRTAAGESRSRRRLIAVLVVATLMFAVVLGQIARLQFLIPDRYVALSQQQRVDIRTLPADRGSILDRNGSELAVSQPARSVFVDPELIEDPSVAAAQVAPLLGLDVATVRERMSGSGRFAYLARKVPAETADRIEALDLAGVAFLDESQRFFPSGSSLRSVLGAVDVDNVGIAGLESQYSTVLAGTPGQLSLERSPAGRTISVGDHELTRAVRGSDLMLTIDRSIQIEAERLLAEQIAQSEARGGVAIVMEPATGEILAMANMVRDRETGEVLVGTNNAALTVQYEPGSVMKTVNIAAALEAGVVQPTTVLQLPEKLTFYEDEFTEAKPRPPVAWDVSEILAQSSNVGSIKIVQSLGAEEMNRMHRAFGFGVPTSLGFPHEAPGAILDPSRYTGSSLPSISLGQGISVTPMQMLLAHNVIANRGRYVEPKLVQSTIAPDGSVQLSTPAASRPVISEQTAEQMIAMLKDVITVGTGRQAAIDGYPVAGKTGTSRKTLESGGYTDANGLTLYQSTFVGFVPADAPALSIYVMIDEPRLGEYSGGYTAAPVFSKLGSFALRRLGVAPPLGDGVRGGSAVAEELAARADDGRRVRAAAVAGPVATSIPDRQD